MPPRDVGAIVVAAGQGTRLGADPPKQYRPIAGVPMLWWSVARLLDEPDVAHLVLVLSAADARQPPAPLADCLAQRPDGRVSLVAGGSTRAASVRAGLLRLPPECNTVLVHDAARPFVSGGVINRVIAAAREVDGALAAVPLQDTLKAAAPAASASSGNAPDSESGTGPAVARTVPRDGLWRAHTPQGFPRAVLERAYVEADATRGGSANGTDDAELVEALGGTVRLVADSPLNFKVTTPADLELAELVGRMLLAERRVGLP